MVRAYPSVGTFELRGESEQKGEGILPSWQHPIRAVRRSRLSTKLLSSLRPTDPLSKVPAQPPTELSRTRNVNSSSFAKLSRSALTWKAEANVRSDGCERTAVESAVAEIYSREAQALAPPREGIRDAEILGGRCEPQVLTGSHSVSWAESTAVVQQQSGVSRAARHRPADE